MRGLLFSLLLGCSLSALGAAAPPMWKSLTPQQQALLSEGNPVVIEENVADNPWPRYVVYRLVNASAEKAAAVFWDCELDTQYVPNCLSVRSVARPKPWIHEAEYTLKMPLFLPDEVYVTRNELKIPSPGIYEISWKVLHARYITGSTGNLRIEPVVVTGETGEKALMRYSNLVIPGGRIAGLLRAQARNEVVDSVNALARQVDQESSQVVAKQITALNKASAGTGAPHRPVDPH